jgi:hypothetical protein
MKLSYSTILKPVEAEFRIVTFIQNITSDRSFPSAMDFKAGTPRQNIG